MAKLTNVAILRAFHVRDGSGLRVRVDPSSGRYDLDGVVLVDRSTGECYRAPALVVRRPDWYLDAGTFAREAPRVTIDQLVREAVGAHPGFEQDRLYDAAVLDCCPTERTPSRGTFAAVLADHPRVEKRKDGAAVVGTLAERGFLRGMTYWPKKAA